MCWRPPLDRSVSLWRRGEVLRTIDGIHPQLASWDGGTHASQIRLQQYLDSVVAALGPLPVGGDLFVHLDVDVGEARRLLVGADLENYLTPLVQRLGHARFRLASATKRLGGGSRLVLGRTESGGASPRGEGWRHFHTRLSGSSASSTWKVGLRSALAATSPARLATGPVAVHLAWRVAPHRNWVNLWKPTGDAMGPVLGEPDPRNPFNPGDDRITRLDLHVTLDSSLGHDVVVGMWWAPHSVE